MTCGLVFTESAHIAIGVRQFSCHFAHNIVCSTAFSLPRSHSLSLFLSHKKSANANTKWQWIEFLIKFIWKCTHETVTVWIGNRHRIYVNVLRFDMFCNQEATKKKYFPPNYWTAILLKVFFLSRFVFIFFSVLLTSACCYFRIFIVVLCLRLWKFMIVQMQRWKTSRHLFTLILRRIIYSQCVPSMNTKCYKMINDAFVWFWQRTVNQTST